MGTHEEHKMNKKKTVKMNLEPYPLNPDISVQYELAFKKDMIKPGDKIKIKGQRGTFVFRRLAHNSKLDVTWIDCSDADTGETRSFYVEKLMKVIRPKRSYRKRVVSG